MSRGLTTPVIGKGAAMHPMGHGCFCACVALAVQRPLGLRLRSAAPRGAWRHFRPYPARSRLGGFATAVSARSARGARRSGGTGRDRGGGAMRPQQAPVSGKVFIQRDYSGGTRCQFQSKFPAELENRVRRGGPGPARGSRRERRTEPARQAGPGPGLTGLRSGGVRRCPVRVGASSAGSPRAG